MTVEIRFLDDVGRFPVKPAFTVSPEGQFTSMRGERRLFKVFCDQSDDIGWIELADLSGEIEVTRHANLDVVKTNAPWAGIIRGDIARVQFTDGIVARIAHNELSDGGY